LKWGPTLPTLTHGDLNHPQEISSAFGGHVAKWNFSFEKLGGEGRGGWGGGVGGHFSKAECWLLWAFHYFP